MTRRKLITTGLICISVISMSFYGFWSLGYNAGHLDGRKEALCSQAELNYDMAILLDNQEMILFSKQALDECFEGGRFNGR
jgi:hypothetical protein